MKRLEKHKAHLIEIEAKIAKNIENIEIATELFINDSNVVKNKLISQYAKNVVQLNRIKKNLNK